MTQNLQRYRILQNIAIRTQKSAICGKDILFQECNLWALCTPNSYRKLLCERDGFLIF